MRQIFFSTLCPEIWLYVLQFLDVKEILYCQSVCRMWEELCDLQSVWRDICESNFTSLVSTHLEEVNGNWKELYRKISSIGTNKSWYGYAVFDGYDGLFYYQQTPKICTRYDRCFGIVSNSEADYNFSVLVCHFGLFYAAIHVHGQNILSISCREIDLSGSKMKGPWISNYTQYFSGFAILRDIYSDVPSALILSEFSNRTSLDNDSFDFLPENIWNFHFLYSDKTNSVSEFPLIKKSCGAVTTPQSPFSRGESIIGCIYKETVAFCMRIRKEEQVIVRCILCWKEETGLEGYFVEARLVTGIEIDSVLRMGLFRGIKKIPVQ